MNFTEEDLKANTILRDRSMIGASLADVEPMTVDKNITFESIGGLDSVVRSLKEMVLFPLMYSEVSHNFLKKYFFVLQYFSSLSSLYYIWAYANLFFISYEPATTCTLYCGV